MSGGPSAGRVSVRVVTAFDIDPTIRPQDDLFRHVNGKWMDRTEIPDDKARWGSFHQLAEDAENAVRDIIEESPPNPDGEAGGKIGALNASFMARDRANRLGRPHPPTHTAAQRNPPPATSATSVALSYIQ